MSFFVSNPIGRILNRFSKDTAVVDSVFVQQVLLATQSFLLGLAYLFLAVWVFPSFGFIFVFQIVAGYVFIKLARIPIVDSLRYDAMSRSSINSLFASSLAYQ